MWAGTEDQRTHPHGCVFCVWCEGGCTGSTEHREHTNVGVFSIVRREGGGKGRTKHEKHTHVGVLSVFDVRAEK